MFDELAQNSDRKDLWWQMVKEREIIEEANRIGVPPPGYSEEDLWDTGHPGHPSNYGYK